MVRGDLLGLTMRSSRGRSKKPVLPLSQVHAFADQLSGEDMHAARVGTLANAVSGALVAGQLEIHAIGRRRLALARVVKLRDLDGHRGHGPLRRYQANKSAGATT